MYYPAKFTPAEEGGYIVTFRDIPEAITQGDDMTEAVEMAEDGEEAMKNSTLQAATTIGTTTESTLL